MYLGKMKKIPFLMYLSVQIGYHLTLMRTGLALIYTSYVGMVVMTTAYIMTIFPNKLFFHFLHLLHLERSKIKKLGMQLKVSLSCTTLSEHFFNYLQFLVVNYKYPIFICVFYNATPSLILIKFNYDLHNIINAYGTTCLSERMLKILKMKKYNMHMKCVKIYGVIECQKPFYVI